MDADVGMSKLSHEGTAGCSAWFHLAGFHFGHPFLTHTHVPSEEPAAGVPGLSEHPAPGGQRRVCRHRHGVLGRSPGGEV